MANSPQARKRARQAEKHRRHNAGQRKSVRTAIKSVLKAIQEGDKDAANEAFKKAVPTIDSMARKGRLHRNTAARHKSRLNTRIKAL